MPTDNRVIRGGAFNNTSNNVRCAYRNNNNPNNRNNNIGFRIVVSTLFSNTPEMRCGVGVSLVLIRSIAEDLYDEEWTGIFLSFLIPSFYEAEEGK